MNFNQKDTWVIIGPGRTGSFLISSYISGIYLYNYNIELAWQSDNYYLNKDSTGTIFHTHNEKCEFIDDFNYVLSYRKITQSALSKFIAINMNQHHLRRSELSSIKITPFYLDPVLFLSHYTHVLSWYKTFYQRGFKVNTVIDYEDFKDDAIDKIPALLNIPKLNDEVLKDYDMNVKTPGSHSTWISNWDEIEPWIKTLSYMDDYCYENYVRPIKNRLTIR